MACNIHDLAEMRQKIAVFRDRKHAGQIMAEMLKREPLDNQTIILAIPSGGVPVSVEMVKALKFPFDIAVVSKILLPWDTEAGFGAVAFDGTVWINQEYAEYYGLNEQDIARQTGEAREKVSRRVKLFRHDRPWPDFNQRSVILVDDGVAAGSTLKVAIMALRHGNARQIIIAVPTGHQESLIRLSSQADEIFCANVRSGRRFSVAAAYQQWTDVDLNDALKMVEPFMQFPSSLP